MSKYEKAESPAGTLRSAREGSNDDLKSYKAEVEVTLYFPATVTVKASNDEEAQRAAYLAVWDCVPDPVSVTLTTAGDEQGIRMEGYFELMDVMVTDCEQVG